MHSPLFEVGGEAVSYVRDIILLLVRRHGWFNVVLLSLLMNVAKHLLVFLVTSEGYCGVVIEDFFSSFGLI